LTIQRNGKLIGEPLDAAEMMNQLSVRLLVLETVVAREGLTTNEELVRLNAMVLAKMDQEMAEWSDDHGD
jgi:hypothetical protein